MALDISTQHIFLGNVNRQLNRWLDRLDRYLWPIDDEIDFSSSFFYVFKPYPSDLSIKQKHSWTDLQIQGLSPFDSGGSYQYQSTQGAHLWYSQNELTGLPETAAQQTLPDGKYTVLGRHFHYEQTWHDHVMTECIQLPLTQKSQDVSEKILATQSWAVKRRLGKQLSSALSWGVIASAIFLVLLAWNTAGLTTLFTQYQITKTLNQELEPKVSEKLSQRAVLEEQQEVLSLLRNWRTEHGYLPESLGVILDRINEMGETRIKEMDWQEHELTLQLDTGEIDIAALISELESIPGLGSVGISPHGATGDFFLEATFHE